MFIFIFIDNKIVFVTKKFFYIRTSSLFVCSINTVSFLNAMI